jgi:hypothetical protein
MGVSCFRSIHKQTPHTSKKEMILERIDNQRTSFQKHLENRQANHENRNQTKQPKQSKQRAAQAAIFRPDSKCSHKQHYFGRTESGKKEKAPLKAETGQITL